jgi:hypothetical protein
MGSRKLDLRKATIARLAQLYPACFYTANPPDVKDLFAWTSGYIEGRRSTLHQTADDNGIELDPNDAKIADGRSGLDAVDM